VDKVSILPEQRRLLSSFSITPSAATWVSVVMTRAGVVYDTPELDQVRNMALELTMRSVIRSPGSASHLLRSRAMGAVAIALIRAGIVQQECFRPLVGKANAGLARANIKFG
jgi:hypothetical protein